MRFYLFSSEDHMRTNQSHRNTVVTFLFLYCMFQTFSFAQAPPMVWGSIPDSDMKMTSFPSDTNASAVILCDYGQSYFNDDLDLVFKKHTRIKILTAKGYEWANQSFILYSGSSKERVSKIEGVTYTLSKDGEVVKTELKDDDIFKEKIDDENTRYRFTLPAVTPGCIIEFQYTISTDNWLFVRDWNFQYSEPVVWSEYRFLVPTTIAYGGVTMGYEPFTFRETNEVDHNFSGTATGVFGRDFKKCKQLRYAVRDLPAIRDEPYITTIDDYKQKLNLQLSEYFIPSRGSVTKVLNTWQTVVNELVDHENFGEKIDDTRRIRALTEELTAGSAAPDEKIRKIYDWITTSIVWSGERRMFAQQDVNDILDSKKGNSADITFLFLSMLKSIGINGDPVILSTRDNGRLQDLYPILSQFNYVLAKVTVDSTVWYVDATDPLRSIDLLPVNVLNVRGLVVKEDSVNWVTINTPKRSVVLSLTTLNVHADGSLTGSCEDAFKDYASISKRRGLDDKKEIEFARETFETGPLSIDIDSVQIEEKDNSSRPLKLKAWISSNTYAQGNGDLIYINPHIIHRITENPFKTKNRKFPIDYAYGRELTTIVNITIPDSFEIKESVLNRSYSVGSREAEFTRRVQHDSARIQIITRFLIQKSEIAADKYERLQNFYNQIVAAESDQFVFSRIKKPVPVMLENTLPTSPNKKETKQKKSGVVTKKAKQ